MAGSHKVAKRSTIKVPESAVAWCLWRLEPQHGKNAEGRPYTTQRRIRCKGDVNERGEVTEVWATTHFSTVDILARWGEGRYLVEFFDVAGTKIDRLTFTLQSPTPRPSPSGEVDPVKRGALESMGPLEFLAYIEQKTERARADAREEADRRADRDREFFQMLMTQARAPAQGAAVDTDLVRRELRVELREQMATVRNELRTALGTIAEREREEPEPDPGYDPPASVDEAAERIGISLIQEVEQVAPELLREAFPAILGWLETKGFKPSQKLKRSIHASASESRAPSLSDAIRAARANRNGAVRDDDLDPDEDDEAGGDDAHAG